MFARMGQERGALLRVCACRQRLLSTTAPILNYICGIELALLPSGGGASEVRVPVAASRGSCLAWQRSYEFVCLPAN